MIHYVKTKILVHVIFFGRLAEITGYSHKDFTGMESTGRLIDHLHQMHPGLSTVHYALAVDQKIVNNNTILDHESTVAFMPPFSGG